MIHFRMQGQFANQAIQYVLARILADRTGLAYRAPPHFKRKDGIPVEWSGSPLFTMQSVEGREGVGAPQVIKALQWFDIESLDQFRPIIVTQWFGQRYELLRPYKDRIRNDWLRIPPERFVETDPETVYIHVRRGDYVEYKPGVKADPMLQGTATTEEEFSDCLRQFHDAKRIRVITDDANYDPGIHGLYDWYRPVSVQCTSWDHDFLTLASARWVVLSQSTYSWLAAFLGRAERIVCPVFSGTFWGNGVGLIGPQMGPGGRDFPNLFVDDEPGRWCWLKE